MTNSAEGVAFLASRGRSNAGALATLDMLGRQAPAPDPTPTPVTPRDIAETVADATAPHTERPKKRVVVSWGRYPGVYMLALEQAPDWEVVDTWRVNEDSLRSLAPVITAILGPGGVKDYTGEFHALGPKAVPAEPKSAPANPRPARQPTARQRAYYGRGGKDRAPDPAVGQRRTPDGPVGSGQGRPLVPGQSSGLSQAEQSGG